MIRLTALLAAALLAMAGTGEAATVAIVNARILTAGPAGVIPSGTVVVRDGKIVAVGAGVTPPGGSGALRGCRPSGEPGPSAGLPVDANPPGMGRRHGRRGGNRRGHQVARYLWAFGWDGRRG